LLLVYFSARVSLTIPRLVLDCDLRFSTSRVAGITGMCQYLWSVDLEVLCLVPFTGAALV
jgi:hypothetical protein